MTRLGDVLRQSRGHAYFRANFLAQRQHQWEQARAGKGWFMWPFSLLLFAYGLGGLAWCIYKGYIVGVLFTLVWLAGLVIITRPARTAWTAHREGRRSRADAT